MSKVVRGFPYEVDFIPTATVCAIAVELQSSVAVSVEFDDSDHTETKRQLGRMEEEGYITVFARNCDHEYLVANNDCPSITAVGDEYFS